MYDAAESHEYVVVDAVCDGHCTFTLITSLLMIVTLS